MRDTLLALLEERPYTATDLAEMLGADPLEVIRLLKRLSQEGVVVRHERGGHVRWARVGTPAPTPERPTHATPGRRRWNDQAFGTKKPSQSLAKAPPSANGHRGRSWWCDLDRRALSQVVSELHDRGYWESGGKERSRRAEGGEEPEVSAARQKGERDLSDGDAN